VLEVAASCEHVVEPVKDRLRVRQPVPHVVRRQAHRGHARARGESNWEEKDEEESIKRLKDDCHPSPGKEQTGGNRDQSRSEGLFALTHGCKSI
jgi:hypothetical protein